MFGGEMDLKKQLMSFARVHNLDWLIGFHNYVRRLFKEQLKELGNRENKDLEDKLKKKALYDYDRILHINTFLMMYSYLEEWLYHFRKTSTPTIPQASEKRGIDRFKDVVKQLAGDVSLKPWQEIKDAEVIRNCLLHANGRISLFKKPEKVRAIIEKKNSNLTIDNDRVVISGDYLQQLNLTISSLMDIMNN